MTDKKLKILYIFPHPDDESFGPVVAMHSQIKDGHEVYLLTLTKGGATKQRFKYNLSIEERGEVRYKEMLKVKDLLGLTEMTVLDMPDSGLKEMDPREIEKIVEEHIKKIQPNILVTYPVHGISGFHDHLVIHPLVKRIFLELKDAGNSYLKRLAFFTLPDKGLSGWIDDGTFRLKNSEEELIDCIYEVDDEGRNILIESLNCYETYKDTIAESGVIEKIGDKIYFEFFMENFKPPVKKITDRIQI
jgi:LmbE family N-acetylglucosaminyl deacetylase